MTKLWSIILALIGITLHSIGILLQKIGTNSLDFKEMLSRGIRNIKISSGLIIWAAGLILAYNISVIPTAVASKGLPPQVVSAMSGLGIVIVIILSYIFLNEKLYKVDIISAIIIVVCIFIICELQQVETTTYIDKTAFYVLTFSPFLLLIPVFIKKLANKTKAVLFSTLSGLTGGVAYVILNLSIKTGWGSFNGIFSSAYIYEYIIIGFISGLFLQVAYKFGDLIHIVPTQMSLTVIYPLICSYFVFHKKILLVQDLSILLIAVCCWIILKLH